MLRTALARCARAQHPTRLLHSTASLCRGGNKAQELLDDLRAQVKSLTAERDVAIARANTQGGTTTLQSIIKTYKLTSVRKI